MRENRSNSRNCEARRGAARKRDYTEVAMHPQQISATQQHLTEEEELERLINQRKVTPTNDRRQIKELSNTIRTHIREMRRKARSDEIGAVPEKHRWIKNIPMLSDGKHDRKSRRSQCSGSINSQRQSGKLPRSECGNDEKLVRREQRRKTRDVQHGHHIRSAHSI